MVAKLISKAAARSGAYKSEEEFIDEAIRTFLAARKDVRLEIGIELYKEGKISIGRACEIAGVGREELKKELNKKGIEIRRGATSRKEVEEETDKLLRRSK